MVEKSPTQRYLVFLVSRPEKWTNAQVIADARAHRHIYLSEEYLDQLRARFRPPKRFDPYDRGHAKSQQFLHDAGISKFYFIDPDLDGALDIRDFPRAREATETLILSGASSAVIADALGKLFALKSTAAMVEVYKNVFFDLSKMDSLAVRAIFDIELAERCEDAIPALRIALRRAAPHDPRRVATKLQGPLAARLALMKLGIFQSSKPDFIALLEKARSLALVRATTSVIGGSPQDAKRCAAYVDIVRLTTDLLERERDPNAALKSAISGFIMTNDVSPLPHVRDLAGSGFTTDVGRDDKKFS